MKLIRHILKNILPHPLFSMLHNTYHRTLAFIGSIKYSSPSQHISVIAITGTKGKSSVAEILNAIFEEAGLNTALASTIRDKSEKNLFKMTMPGRFFLQQFLRDAVDAHCSHAIIEMTSEGVKQFRHTYIDLDALIFTNLSPEHIEAHGSFEKYVAAKLKLKEALEHSPKKTRTIVSNIDDDHGELFLDADVEKRVSYSLKDAAPYNVRDNGVALTLEGIYVSSPLRGLFNIYNILAAATFAESKGITLETIKRALEKLDHIPGRVEFVRKGQSYEVVVDYAHTPDSLEKLYKVFPDRSKICVLGNTGGGRDAWKRPEMAKIANEYCSTVILTNEDPYDEDPQKIVDAMAKHITKTKSVIIMDRRKAIRHGLEIAHPKDVVLITGKGTDPYIMGARGSKVGWSDRSVVEEELAKIEHTKSKQNPTS
jgi:UDP-N-acetylmuramoyl-L-alanyl-D-glutamate--2,6-diaminopimelate ligase